MSRWAQLWWPVLGAVVACGSDAATGSNGTKPNVPPSVTATVASGKITLEWTEVAGATSYNMYMASESGVLKSNYVTLAGNMYHPGNPSGKFDHPDGLLSDVTYYFVVTALNSAGESAESCEVTARIDTAAGGTC